MMYANKNKTYRHVNFHNTFVKIHSNCVSRFSKYKNLQINHFFNHNNEHPINYKNAKWLKNPNSTINKVFRYKTSNYKSIVIHTNRNFAVVSGYIDYNYVKLIKRKKLEKLLIFFNKKLKK